MKFRAMKFRVNNPAHSERVQRILFDMGYEWMIGGKDINHADRPYLYAEWDGDILSGSSESDFREDPNTEIDVSWLDTTDDETIEIEGRTYRKSDVVDRLAELDPVE